jgi:tRNA U38,U39,U40 pseudouridine synthase TruA
MGNSVYVNLQGQSFGRDQVRSLVESIAQYQKDGGQVIFA